MPHSTTLADMIADRPLHSVGPDETVRTACIVMRSVNVGALPVVDQVGRLVGIISERDVIQRSVIVYRPSEETPVKQIMTRNPRWLPSSATPAAAAQEMLRGRFRHLPVCDDGRVIGIVSIRDINMMSEWMQNQTEAAGMMQPAPSPDVPPHINGAL